MTNKIIEEKYTNCVSCGTQYPDSHAYCSNCEWWNPNSDEKMSSIDFEDAIETLRGLELPFKNHSAESAKKFTKAYILEGALPIPNIEINPDHEVAFTWRKQGNGIFNLSFDRKGGATWATFIEKGKERGKGYFSDVLEDRTVKVIKPYIEDICKTKKETYEKVGQ